jgi:hypothetical protein
MYLYQDQNGGITMFPPEQFDTYKALGYDIFEESSPEALALLAQIDNSGISVYRKQFVEGLIRTNILVEVEQRISDIADPLERALTKNFFSNAAEFRNGDPTVLYLLGASSSAEAFDFLAYAATL